MFGRKAVRLTPAASGKAKARMASHFRRLQTSSNVSRPAPFRVSSVTAWSLQTPRSLRHQDDVGVAEVKVLLLGGELVVVEGNPLHRCPLGTEDDDPRARCELRESTGQRSEEQTSELQSLAYLVRRLLREIKIKSYR